MACGSALNKNFGTFRFFSASAPCEADQGSKADVADQDYHSAPACNFLLIRKDPYYPRQDAAKAPTFTEVSLTSLCPR